MISKLLQLLRWVIDDFVDYAFRLIAGGILTYATKFAVDAPNPSAATVLPNDPGYLTTYYGVTMGLIRIQLLFSLLVGILFGAVTVAQLQYRRATPMLSPRISEVKSRSSQVFLLYILVGVCSCVAPIIANTPPFNNLFNLQLHQRVWLLAFIGVADLLSVILGALAAALVIFVLAPGGTARIVAAPAPMRFLFRYLDAKA